MPKLIKNEEGSIIGVEGITRDISHIKRAEEEKAALENQLFQAQKMEAIGTLVGGISHDFNNLLQVINGYSQMLLMGKSANDPDHKKLSNIVNAGERAVSLINQLLLFSRKGETHRKSVNLNREVEQARTLLERIIPKMVEITVRTGSRLWDISADPIQIEQILLNLGKNAADAMLEGGTITIETENVVLG